MMHGNRRRKKRPSYGVRTVEITKGHSGFGFTISGQAPCILSSIVPVSPAEKAGLRQGDYLIAVNGQNVSKVPHDDVVRLIGQSKLLKLQIAENYYSDSSDDEFTLNRPKPKYPNRLRHKHQQTRAEKVVRDLQSGAIFSEHAAIHNSENAPLSDRDWTDNFPPPDPYVVSTAPLSVPTTLTSVGIVHNPPKSSASPTRLRPDQIRLVMAEARHVPRNSRLVRNEAPLHPPRMRASPIKREKILKAKAVTPPLVEIQMSRQPQILSMRQPLQTKTNFQHHHVHNNNNNSNNNNGPHVHKSQGPVDHRSMNLRQQYQDNLNIALTNHCHPTFRQYPTDNNPLVKAVHQGSVLQMNQQLKLQMNWHRNKALSSQQEMFQHHLKQQLQYKVANSLETVNNSITEQEINNLLYPTLAELQQSRVVSAGGNMGESIYQAVVGYLGTIEMPKDPQGGSRLTAIRNCIRRLRIEKKVHTLVLMSIFTEQVVLINSHGLTLAEYPAERITFCGVYADDKKFFGLVTVHGVSGDEISEVSQDENGEVSSISSSCHVFMVDPNATQHPDHCRRAKNFHIDCTIIHNQEDGSSHCLEFPDSADPILHSIMSLYRNRVGFNLDNVATGLIDVDAQMSPPHSNTSSNSSNSDSGIGFRDDGSHHYHNSDRIFVVEYDENQRTRLQNGHPNHCGANENIRANTLGAAKSNGKNGPSAFNGVRKIASETFSSNSRAHGSDNNQNMNSQDRKKEPQRSFINTEMCSNEMETEEIEEKEVVPTMPLLDRPNDGRKSKLDGRISVTEELRTVFLENNFEDQSRDCISPNDQNRLTVRAMPDPVSFERSPCYYVSPEAPVQITSMRQSMHKYLQHKQDHLVKVSQKINRRESDSGPSHTPVSTRTFSPSADLGGRQTPNFMNTPSTTIDLSLKLSPKVFGVPFRPSAPSEHSFTRSLEDLRDSSTSDGVGGAMCVNGTGFRDGSESDHCLARLLHASETNLVRCGPIGSFPESGTRGAFRAVHPRNPPLLLPMDQLSDDRVMDTGSYMSSTDAVDRPMDSADENTETTDNTGGQGGSQDVHPPTQDEFSHDSDFEQVEGNEEKKHRAISLRRLSRSRLPNDRTAVTTDSNASQSDSENRKIIGGPAIRVINGGGQESLLEMSRVGAWASSFEKMVEDPAGLHTFAEFLKKEYSHENIYFWTACQRYKQIQNQQERQEMAKSIFNTHLGIGASEPVNVDSQARQFTEDGLQQPDEFLFSAAQKQIFNLMKFDSYSRFLKSDLYNKCLNQDRKGLPLPYVGDDPDLDISENNFSKHLKKSKSDADEHRRKSLLPWNRKDRSKSKDRGEAEYIRRKKLGHRSTSESSSTRSDITDSHTSLNSADFTANRRTVSRESLTSVDAVSLSGNEGCSLCRFILPDQSNSVLALRPGETIKDVVRQLLDRRRIHFTAFNVILTKSDKPIDLNKDCILLSNLEVRVERMVLFSMHLRNRKVVYVRANTTKIICDVLKPILTKYGLKLDLMVINKCGKNNGINLKGPITDLDGEKLIIQTKEEIKEWTEPGRSTNRNSKLDEITNLVFEDLLNGKTQSSFDDLGVLDFDSRSTKTDPTSDTSSSLIDSFSRRESLSLERNSSKPGTMFNRSSKRRGIKPTVISTQEKELYEGLKRAQMSRLDDQRGTEINFELPDFLKSDQNQGGGTGDFLAHFDGSFHSCSSEGMDQTEFLSQAHPEVWGDIQPSTSSADVTLIGPQDLDLDDLEETLRSPSFDKTELTSRAERQSPFITPPPPLPPKPKLGGPARGPPPRPPSKQLVPFSHLIEAPLRSSMDKFSVSFV